MPISNVDDPAAVTDCATAPLPAGVSAADCYAPERNYGPIRNLYYTRTPFAAAPTAVEIARRLALFDSDPTDPEAMVGPIVAQVSINGINYPKPADISFDVTIFDTSEAQYDFMRSGQKGGSNGYFYGVDSAPYWIGGQNGLIGGRSALFSGYNWPTDETALQTITGNISGLGIYDAKRIASPVPVV
jgi:hypothetical protein